MKWWRVLLIPKYLIFGRPWMKENKGFITIERLEKIFKKNFKPPFVPEGLVDVSLYMDWAHRPALSIRIGPRDIQIDEHGNVRSSGTGGWSEEDPAT